MPVDSASTPFKRRVEDYFKYLQNIICSELESIDGKAKFTQDVWAHKEIGGGKTRIMQKGNIFEKAGVNFSSVTTRLTDALASRLSVKVEKIFASGISLVIHPTSPMVPTVHMNVRYLELANGDAWFGGGMDLTPNYLFENDVKHFHRVLKLTCDKHDTSFYPKFKQWCDEYFFIKHRKEARGVGGIFFDNLRGNPEETFLFVQDVGNAFLDAYAPIVASCKNLPWSEKEKSWQLIRRGRYVEFNLVYDRGTLFGLETDGRTESILMSLPPEVKWQYNFQPPAGSREDQLLHVLQHPREWV